MYGRRRSYKRRYSRRKYRTSSFRRKSAYRKVRVSPYSRANVNKLAYALRNTGKRRPSSSSKGKRSWWDAVTDVAGAFDHASRFTNPYGLSASEIKKLRPWFQEGGATVMPPPQAPQIGL